SVVPRDKGMLMLLWHVEKPCLSSFHNRDKVDDVLQPLHQPKESKRWGKKTRGSGPPRGSSTHPAPQAPFAPPATDSAGLENDPEDVTDEEIFVHENMPSDGDGDATLRAAPNLHMLQTLTLDKPTSSDVTRPSENIILLVSDGFIDHLLDQNPQSQFTSHGWGPGPDSKSMLDLLNVQVQDFPLYDSSFSQPPFSMSNQA
ncbi:hypothetical protein DXG01_011059, partial [Tephrocybe rancida]